MPWVPHAERWLGAICSEVVAVCGHAAMSFGYCFEPPP